MSVTSSLCVFAAHICMLRFATQICELLTKIISTVMGSKILEMTGCSLFPYHLLPFFTNKEKQIFAIFSIKMMIEETYISVSEDW